MFSHQDTILTFENKNLLGLPDKFSPSMFDIEKMELSIGGKSLVFPPCVSKYFLDNDDYILEISASWYHDLRNIPPYISFYLKFTNRDYAYNLLFSLDTLEAIEFEVQTYADSGLFLHTIEIGSYCMESIRKNLTKAKST
ncbi:hypothetical protein NBRC116493_04670 [Aurantivibrio infirmus]